MPSTAISAHARAARRILDSKQRSHGWGEGPAAGLGMPLEINNQQSCRCASGCRAWAPFRVRQTRELPGPGAPGPFSSLASGKTRAVQAGLAWGACFWHLNHLGGALCHQVTPSGSPVPAAADYHGSASRHRPAAGHRCAAVAARLSTAGSLCIKHIACRQSLERRSLSRLFPLGSRNRTKKLLLILVGRPLYLRSTQQTVTAVARRPGPLLD